VAGQKSGCITYKRYFGSNADCVETFWDAAECRFSPWAVRLVLHENLNENTDYAYFLLTASNSETNFQ
jgi:hypothetical protein